MSDFRKQLDKYLKEYTEFCDKYSACKYCIYQEADSCFAQFLFDKDKKKYNMTNQEAFYIIGNIPIPTDDANYDICQYQEAKAVALDCIQKIDDIRDEFNKLNVSDLTLENLTLFVFKLDELLNK